MSGLVQQLVQIRFVATLVLVLTSVAGCAGAVSFGDIAAEAPTLGSGEAPVTIVVFGDYQCGPCAAHGRRLRQLMAERPGELRLVYRHCPSSRHPLGREAAMVAVAAENQDNFWGLHWRLIDSGPIDRESQLLDILGDIDIDRNLLADDIRSGEPEKTLRRDIDLADRLEIRGTPTTYINGRKIEGARTIQRLRAEIENARRRKGERVP